MDQAQDSAAEQSSLAELLTLPEFPRSARYRPEWMLENLMGPNAVWLAEALSQVLPLEPGMRVLDMGCGRAISSIFLAKEFGCQVWATDLWIKPSENWGRIREAGLEDRIFPIYAEAHALPFAEEFFDAAISLDAYHYFGTDDLYLGYYARFVEPGGLLALVVPGIVQEFTEGVPPHLAPFWEQEFWSFHSPDWWRRQWERTGPVAVTHANMVPNGWRHWLTWLEVAGAHGYRSSAEEAEMVRLDAGRNLGFTRLVARKRQ
jgi:SAM-dependent methyltransferase